MAVSLNSRRPITRTDERAVQIALAVLAESTGSIGCSRIADVLGSAGIAMSEPTAGRLLRDLDRMGLVQRAGGKNGRVITPKGQEVLAALELSQQAKEHNDEFLRAISARSVQDVIDLLNIRRAVESEIARMAALRATEDDIREIERAIEAYVVVMRDGASGQEEHRAVHRAIANAAKSTVSSAVVNLILRDPKVYETMKKIQHFIGSMAPEAHRPVLAAIRDRHPDAAAAAMRAHLDRVVSAAERFAEVLAGGQLDGPERQG